MGPYFQKRPTGGAQLGVHIRLRSGSRPSGLGGGPNISLEEKSKSQSRKAEFWARSCQEISLVSQCLPVLPGNQSCQSWRTCQSWPLTVRASPVTKSLRASRAQRLHEDSILFMNEHKSKTRRSSFSLPLSLSLSRSLSFLSLSLSLSLYLSLSRRFKRLPRKLTCLGVSIEYIYIYIYILYLIYSMYTFHMWLTYIWYICIDHKLYMVYIIYDIDNC